MERLTIRNSDGSVSQPTGLKWAVALERLAAYEDMGLEPEGVKAVLEGAVKEFADYDNKMQELCNAVKAFASRVPAADVAPVVHGRWVKEETMYTDTVCCSACGEEFVDDCDMAVDGWAKYCPNCGAKMDGGGA